MILSNLKIHLFPKFFIEEFEQQIYSALCICYFIKSWQYYEAKLLHLLSKKINKSTVKLCEVTELLSTKMKFKILLCLIVQSMFFILLLRNLKFIISIRRNSWKRKQTEMIMIGFGLLIESLSHFSSNL